MIITKKQKEKPLIVRLEGRLDTGTAPKLEETLKENLDAAEELVLDFSNLEYISSAGLRVLMWAKKTMSRKDGMKVLNPNEIVQEVFEVTGFNSILTIEMTE